MTKYFPTNCFICNKAIFRNTRDMRLPKDRHTCSQECKNKSLLIKQQSYTKPLKENNYIKIPHPELKTSIPQHREVMEAKLGRALISEEIVHHIDEDKSNNDIDNLQIVTRAEHARIHRSKESSLAWLKPNEVYDILTSMYNKEMTQPQIAKKYKVNPSSIVNISRGHTWKTIYKKWHEDHTPIGESPKTSKYKGVTWRELDKKWEVNILDTKLSGKMARIGLFSNEEDAAKAYNEMALLIYGESAKLNEVVLNA